MLNIKLSSFLRIGLILYGVTQFSYLVDVLLEPENTLSYVYGAIYKDIRKQIELPVIQIWFIVFVPVLNLLLIVGGVLKNTRLIEIYLFVSYFSLLLSLPTTFMAVAYANVYSISRVRELMWTIFGLTCIHALVKHWKSKLIDKDEEIEEILEETLQTA